MLVAFIALAAAPVTDWGPFKAAAENYAMCAHTAAGPFVRSKQSVEAVVETAMSACPAEAERLRAATVTVYSTIGLTQAELDEAVNEEFAKQMTLMRRMLGKAITDYRR